MAEVLIEDISGAALEPWDSASPPQPGDKIVGFQVGMTTTFIVEATMPVTSTTAFSHLRVKDVAGNQIPCDPVVTLVVRATGKPETQVFQNVIAAEHFVSVFNSDNGVKNLDIDVNGEKFKIAGLADGAVRSFDIAAALHEGSDNVVAVTAYGKPGASATVVIADVVV